MRDASQLVYLAVLQEGKLLLTKDAYGRWDLPSYYELESVPWDINPLVQGWTLFGWSVDLLRRPVLRELTSTDMRVLCAVCQFDADHKSAGSISESIITRIWPDALIEVISNSAPVVRVVSEQAILATVPQAQLGKLRPAPEHGL